MLASQQIRDRILAVLAKWGQVSPSAPQQPPMGNADAQTRPDPVGCGRGVWDNDRLDLAVACGAAYFGLVRRGEGVRIEAKLARSYYLVVSDSPPDGHVYCWR